MKQTLSHLPMSEGQWAAICFCTSHTLDFLLAQTLALQVTCVGSQGALLMCKVIGTSEKKTMPSKGAESLYW